jgi:hypothetical protein
VPVVIDHGLLPNPIQRWHPSPIKQKNAVRPIPTSPRIKWRRISRTAENLLLGLVRLQG